MICPRCGTSLPDGVAFCTVCGPDPRPPDASATGQGSPLQQMVTNERPMVQQHPYQQPSDGAMEPVGPVDTSACAPSSTPGPVPIPYPDMKGPVGSSADKVDLSDKPAASKGSDPFIVTAVIVGLIAVAGVVTGEIGGASIVDVVGELQGEVGFAPVEHNYTIADGGVHTAGIVIIAVFLLLATLAALLAILRPRPPLNKYLNIAGIALAVGALVASVTAYAIFRSWVMDQVHTDLWAGSSVYAGTIGSMLIIGLLGFALWRAHREMGTPS